MRLIGHHCEGIKEQGLDWGEEGEWCWWREREGRRKGGGGRGREGEDDDVASYVTWKVRWHDM